MALMQLTLGDGGSIPAIGVGTWPMDDAEAARVIPIAIELGYRLVDTAFAYGNETGVGNGIKAAQIAREELFVTTKFNAHSHSVEGVAKAWEDSVRKLQVEYLDLMLIHWPNPKQDQYVAAWEGLVALAEQGKVRHIGTSNFLPEHLERIIAATGVTPALDQLQITPRYQQRDAREFNAERGILTQAWSPLGQGTGLLELPVFGEIAARHDITPAQTILAWNLASGMSTIPKSSSRQRLAENLAAESIVLDAQDIEQINAVTEPEPNPTHPNEFGH